MHWRQAWSHRRLGRPGQPQQQVPLQVGPATMRPQEAAMLFSACLQLATLQTHISWLLSQSWPQLCSGLPYTSRLRQHACCSAALPCSVRLAITSRMLASAAQSGLSSFRSVGLFASLVQQIRLSQAPISAAPLEGAQLAALPCCMPLQVQAPLPCLHVGMAYCRDTEGHDHVCGSLQVPPFWPLSPRGHPSRPCR